MPFELSLLWGIHAILTLFIIGALIALSRSSYRRTLVFRFSQAIELPLVTDTIAAAATRRILHRTAAVMAGGLVGILASAVVVYLNPASASAPTIWLVTLPLTLTGMCAGAAFVAFRESLFHRHPDAVRVARPVTVTTTWSIGLGLQLFTWGFLVILFSFSFGQAQSYFRFRLWPNVVLESSEAASSERPSAP